MKRIINLIVMGALLMIGGRVFAQDTHEYVDLGLPSGTLWATCNVGANAPEEFGDYFAWGETAPKDVYNWSTYQYYDGSNLAKYTGSDGLTTLLPEDDAATTNWGNEWRMPTKEEWQELLDNTTNKWTTQNGVNGRLFTGSNGNSLFLPAVGFRWDDDLNYVGSYGYYWSSSLNTDGPNDAWLFDLYSDYYGMYSLYRGYGQSVRAVRSASVGGDHAYIDLGLPSGLLWATCNVGANAPEEYGDYFAWGETQPKDYYDWSTYQHCMGSENTLTKYCTDPYSGYNGFTDNLTILLPEDDAATANWGNGWRMPTLEEWGELFDNTTVTWTQQNGVNGRLFTASNGNSLFLPAAGYRWDGGLYDVGSDGGYWSSSLATDDPDNAWFFGLIWEYYQYPMYGFERSDGHSVRAVRSASVNYGNVEIPEGMSNTDIIISNFSEDAIPDENGNFFIGYSKMLTAKNAENGKIIYISSISADYEIAKGDRQQNYELSAKETALHCALCLLPFGTYQSKDSTFNSMKDALYELTCVKNLETAIENTVNQYGYLKTDEISTEMNALWDYLRADLLDRFFENGKSVSEQNTYIINKIELKKDGTIVYSIPNLPISQYRGVRLDINANGTHFNPNTNTWTLAMTGYSENGVYIGLNKGRIADDGLAYPSNERIHYFLPPMNVGKFMGTFTSYSGLCAYFQDTWRLFFEPGFGFDDMTWDMAKLDGITFELSRNDNAICIMSPKYSQETAVINVVYASLQVIGMALDDIFRTEGITAFLTSFLNDAEFMSSVYANFGGGLSNFYQLSLVVLERFADFLVTEGWNYLLPQINLEKALDYVSSSAARAALELIGNELGMIASWGLFDSFAFAVEAEFNNDLLTIDLGLPSGLLWATCNVGANAPEEHGDYFAWGETQPKYAYNWDTYQYYDGSNVTKYTGSDGLTILLPEDDAATANWGDGWRMPTKEEWRELYQNTTSTWTTQNGANGRLFTAPNGNSLFLPASGGRSDRDLYDAGSSGYFWSSSLNMDDTDDAWEFGLHSGGCYISSDDRYRGLSVRAVRAASHEYVDLGLPSGLLWATCNVGANAPEEYGDYFAWGETQPKDVYNWDTYQYYDGSNVTKYTGSDGLTILLPEDDAATANWGDGWRMPTKEEWQELLDNTTHTWTTRNGVNGLLFTAANGNNLFLPAAGGRWDNDLYNAGSSGYFWSSSLSTADPNYAWFFYFSSNYGMSDYYRYYGRSVRAVHSASPVLSYIITATANPVEGGTVSGAGTYETGTTCTLTATANAGYTFQNWTENGEVVSTEAEYSFTVTGDRTLVANFVEIGGGDHTYVDLGLPSGLLWATCNVGANAPEEYGDYFAWGETQPKDGGYTWGTYQYCMGSNNTLTKYCNDPNYGYNGFTDNLTILLPEDDAATANWGDEWRMPTKEEWQELYQNTTSIWTTQNGVNGRLFTASNGNSLFLPAAGYRRDRSLLDVGSYGDYWSSSLDTDNPKCALFFGFRSYDYFMAYYARYTGRSVRAVRSASPVLSYIITATANPTEGGTVSGAGTYEMGTTCTITATANAGYTFTNWTENGEVVSTEAEYSFTVTGDRTLVANFVEIGGDDHTYVDLGLPSGLLWATCNVGANAPEEYGDYFAWGETQPKDVYNLSTYQYCIMGSATSLTKYCTHPSYGYNGFTDNLTILLPEDDAATANWGNGWRMPTKEEWQELLDNTTNTWTTQNGVNGRLFTAPNGNSLFLPAAGWRYNSRLAGAGSRGLYWSSSLYTGSPSHAWYFGFSSGSGYVVDYVGRGEGHSVRAVRSTRQN